jgi:Immunity protein 35
VLSRDEAREIAEAFLQAEIQPQIAEEVLVTELREYPGAWVAVYNSRKFAETGSISYALAGNSPLIINKETRSIRVGITGAPIEDQLGSP